MGRKMVRVATFILVCALAQPLVAASGKGKLSLAQIEKLITIHAPDNVVAGAVQSRGLAFTPTPRIVVQIQKHGAGPATLAAIRRQIPFCKLEVDGPPGSQVTVDGSFRGAISAQGRLVVQNLLSGTHQLEVRKTGYQPENLSFNLAAHQYKRVPAKLVWGGGYLTISSDPPGGTIEIPGIGRYNTGVSNLPCPPGTYIITVVRPRMKRDSRSVVVTAGRHVTVEFHLTPDPQYLQSQLTAARQQYARGNAGGAVQMATRLLSFEPNNPHVLSLLASAYLRIHHVAHFQMDAENAIRRGGSVRLNLMHENRGFRGESINPVTLVISATTISYEPRSATHRYRPFSAPIANIEQTEVTNEGATGFIILRHLTPGTYLLHLEIRDPKRSNRKTSFFFAIANSRIERVNNIGYLASSSDSSRVLGAIANVIRHTAAAVPHR